MVVGISLMYKMIKWNIFLKYFTVDATEVAILQKKYVTFLNISIYLLVCKKLIKYNKYK